MLTTIAGFSSMSFVHGIVSPILYGNAKRRETCQKLGGDKKYRGHLYETYFKSQYNPESLYQPVEYGPTSDASICASSDFARYLSGELDLPSYPDVEYYTTSIKSGTSHQYILGNIPELQCEDNLSVFNEKPRCAELFNKYLKKAYSMKPSDILTFYDIPVKKWVFFNMDNVVGFIADNASWRKLQSGRIKGDFNDGSCKGYSQYITYEHRDSHKSDFLGLNCGKGEKFIRLLQKHLAFVEDDLMITSQVLLLPPPPPPPLLLEWYLLSNLHSLYRIIICNFFYYHLEYFFWYFHKIEQQK